MKIVYIAGRFTAASLPEIGMNIAKAEEAAATLNELCDGAVLALCPHSLGRMMVGTMTPEFWYEATLELLARCDAMLLLSGWETSSGSRKEKDFAKARGIPCFDDIDDAVEWVENSQ